MSIDYFVGRQHELEQLSKTLETVITYKEPKFILIEGDFGQGKTALVEYFLTSVRDAYPDMLIGSAICTTTNKLSGLVPFGQVVEQLSEKGVHSRRLNADFRDFLKNVAPAWISIIPVIGNAAAAVAQTASEGSKFLSKSSYLPENVFVQFTNFLSDLAEDHPLLIFIDDLQWADESSMDLLSHLTRHLKEIPVFFICAYRPDANQVEKFREFYSKLQRPRNSPEILLQQGIDIREYLKKRYSLDNFSEKLVNKIQKTTGGHPLFINQLCSLWEESGILTKSKLAWTIINEEKITVTIPNNMQAILEERLSGLDDQLRDILYLASVQGDEFILQGISGISQWDESQVAYSLQILTQQHGLVNEISQQEVGDIIVDVYRFSHRFFSDYIYGQLTKARRRILHAKTAECLAKLHEQNTYPVAGDLAIHFEKAHQLYESASYALLAGKFEQARYGWAEAQNWYQFGLDLLGKVPQNEKVKKLSMQLLDQSGDGFYRIGDYKKASGSYRKGLDISTGLNDIRKVIEFDAKLSDVYAYLCLAKEAAFFVKKAQAELATFSNEIPFCELHVKVGWIDGVIKATVLGRNKQVADERKLLLEQVKQLPETKGLKFIMARIYNSWGIVCKKLNDYQRAESYYCQAVNLLKSIGETGLAASYGVNLAQTYFERLNRFNESKELIMQGIKVHQQIGDLDSLQFAKETQGGLLITMGQYEQALLVLNEAKSIIESYQTDFWWNEREVYARIALAYLGLRNIEEAYDYSIKSLSKARKGRNIAGLAHSHDVFGQIEDAQNNWQAAEHHFTRATRIYQRIGDKHFSAQVKRNLANTLSKQDKIIQARQLLIEAMQVFEELDLQYEIRKTQPLLTATQTGNLS